VGDIGESAMVGFVVVGRIVDNSVDTAHVGPVGGSSFTRASRNTLFEHLRVVDLTQDVLDAALDCARQVNNLRQSRGDYEVCDDKKGLEGASGTFISKFAPWSKV